MPKDDALIAVAEHSPDHGDGSIRWGDSVAFEYAPADGVISAYGHQDGVLVESWALWLGTTGLVLQPNANVDRSSATTVDVTQSVLLHGRVRVVADTSFEIVAS